MTQERVQIECSYCERYSSNQRAHFHDTVYGILQECGAVAEVHVPESLMADYRSCIDMEIAALGRVRLTAFNEKIRQKDEERKQYIGYLFRLIETGVHSPLKEVAGAAQMLLPLVRKYRDYRKGGILARSSTVLGLIDALQQSERAAYVQLLRLEEGIAALKQSNAECMAEISRRADERIAGKMDNTLVLRPRTDGVYRDICERIYASQVLCEDAEVMLRIQALIRQINQAITENLRSYRQSLGQRRAARKKNGEEG